MNEDHKRWIDNASYYALLKRWRFSSSEDDIFHGTSGEYYSARMMELKNKIGSNAHTMTSKQVGWGQ